MTDREAHRKACLRAMKEAAIAYKVPEKCQDPQILWWEIMTDAFDSIHGIARVNPVEPTKEMVGVELHSDELDCRPTPRDLCIIFDTMSAAGDLTDAPEPR